ncbi:MAG: hypothetical protein U0517_03340 [Candidatus Andersenbacteria bacterium]
MQFKLVKINEERALQVFRTLDSAWKNRDSVFKNIKLPQDRIKPTETDPRLLGLWFLFTVQTQRGGVGSEVPMRLLLSLFEDPAAREMFIPERIITDWPAERIEKTLRDGVIARLLQAAETTDAQPGLFGESEVCPTQAKGNGHIQRNKQLTRVQLLAKLEEEVKGYRFDELSQSWYSNAHSLVNHWGGDVRNVFWGVTEFEEAFRRVDYYRAPKAGFYGMRRKIFSLLVIWLQERGLAPFFPAPVPVDFHALRVLTATGCVEFSKALPIPNKPKYPGWMHGKVAVRINEGIMDEIACWSQTFLVKHDLSHLAVNPALWVLSRELCMLNPGNKTSSKGATYVLPEQLAQDARLWPRNYHDVCSKCPVGASCTKVSPSGTYYKWGLLMTQLPRVPFPLLGATQVLPEMAEQHSLSLSGWRQRR